MSYLRCVLMQLANGFDSYGQMTYLTCLSILSFAETLKRVFGQQGLQFSKTKRRQSICNSQNLPLQHKEAAVNEAPGANLNGVAVFLFYFFNEKPFHSLLSCPVHRAWPSLCRSDRC